MQFCILKKRPQCLGLLSRVPIDQVIRAWRINKREETKAEVQILQMHFCEYRHEGLPPQFGPLNWI